MRSSHHGQIGHVSPQVASTVTQGGTLRYSKILTKEETAQQPGTARPNVFPFGYMFEALLGPNRAPRPEVQLPAGGKTAARLAALSAAMFDDKPPGSANATVPAVYTYLGQFIDHDITKTETLDPAVGSTMEAALQAAKAGASISPLDDDRRASVINKRMPALNLDSVLSAAAPRDALGALEVGKVTAIPLARPTLPFTEPAALAELHDLPRLPPTSTNEELDRRARIGDPRNDENLVVAQLHVAFLRAHRRMVHDLGMSRAKADLALQQVYQAIVLHDFLPAVCDDNVVRAIVARPGLFYRPTRSNPYMPLEFAAGAYRFGHSMVRDGYDYNSEFSGRDGKPIARLADLFTFTAFSGQNFDLPTLPHNWIIDWTRWVDPQRNPARAIDTTIAKGLMDLPQHQGVIGGTDVNILALRNLVRGYLLGLPTGQAVAQLVKEAIPGVTPLTKAQLRDVAKSASQAQHDALVAGGFDTCTPLWYYMLAEAAHGGGSKLGPIASAIVCDVLVQLVRLSEDNVLSVPHWQCPIPAAVPGKPTIVDLFRFAQLFP